MLGLKLNGDGSIETTLCSIEELFDIAKRLFSSTLANEFLHYDPNWLAVHYADSCLQWLNSPDDALRAPYEIIHDYRSYPLMDWGKFVFKGKYNFPHELAEVKSIMERKFRKMGRLYKGDNSCPRVSNIKTEQHTLLLEIQKACYYDQVATNLSLDYKHEAKIAQHLGYSTIRDWDIAQSNTPKGQLPSLVKSRLANTIGVALGIVATDKHGRKMLLTRERTSSVAVYSKMLHLPFSFALNFDSNQLKENYCGTLQEPIKPDFRHEQAQELGLEPADIDFNQIKPLLFCRDLCRGGKPQFFLDVELKIPYEDLLKKIVEQSSPKNEFKAQPFGLTLQQAVKDTHHFSPELLAYVILKMQDNN